MTDSNGSIEGYRSPVIPSLAAFTNSPKKKMGIRSEPPLSLKIAPENVFEMKKREFEETLEKA